MVPIYWGGGSEATDVVTIFRSSVGLPDTFYCHRSELGIINGLTTPSEVIIFLLLLKSKPIYTIQNVIRWRYCPFFQGWICDDSALAVEIFVLVVSVNILARCSAA